MKKQVQFIALFTFIILFFTSCELVGDIFKAGIGFGIFIVVAIIALILYLISKFGGRNK